MYKIISEIKLKPINITKEYFVDRDAYDGNQTIKDIESFEKSIITDEIIKDNKDVYTGDIESVVVNVQIIDDEIVTDL